MTPHIFGAVSSPTCANYDLRKTATENAENFSPDCVNSVFQNFYVDDLLKSAIDLESAQKLASEIRELCKSGGFNLTKFVASDKEILKEIPLENQLHPENSTNLETFDFVDKSQSQLEEPCIERALGIKWNITNDTLGFRIELRNRPNTRRGFLSSISSIFDALGLASPFLLKGRKILQRLS